RLRLSSPGLKPIPREARKSLRQRPPLRSGPRGVRRRSSSACPSPSRLRWSRARNTNRRSDMANIGSFKKVGNDFQGEIITLSLQAKGVRIVAEQNRSSNENAPSHRVFVGRAEIGAAWSKRSEEGRDYLSLKLDDPSFNAPIYANLFDDEGGEGYSLLWSRPRKNGERGSLRS